MAEPRKFYLGLGLMIGFLVVLVLLFLPLSEGKNALDHLDDLYNSISKGSAYYIDDLESRAGPLVGKDIEVGLTLNDESQASEAVALLGESGASVERDGAKLAVKGDLGRILERCLQDTKDMFANDGEAVTKRYPDSEISERKMLFNWWTVLRSLTKDLRRQEKFSEAKTVGLVTTRGVECAYNYYGIEPEKISSKVPIVLFSLAFYVLYTIWYGFAILFMFEGWGLKLSH